MKVIAITFNYPETGKLLSLHDIQLLLQQAVVR